MGSHNDSSSSSAATSSSSSQHTIRTLVQQIVHDKKGLNKEQRIAACEELRKLLLSLDTISILIDHDICLNKSVYRDVNFFAKCFDLPNFEYNWREMGGDLMSLLATRINPDTKRAVAECIGALGFLLASQYDQYVKFIMDSAKRSSEKYTEERTMIMRAMACSLNLIGVYSAQSRVAPVHIEDVMTAVKKQLDMNESPTVLIPLLDICIAVAKYFPAVFKKSFDDIVDFTVGWYVEPDQPKSVGDKCAELLTDLRAFWFDALPTAVTLMKQFVTDINAYLEELGTDKETKVEEALRKTASILRALVTILNICNVPQARPTIIPFVEKLFGQIARQSAYLKRILSNEVGEVLVAMADVLWCALEVQPKAEWLNACVKSLRVMISHPAVGYVTVLKLLDFYEMVFDRMPNELSAAVIPQIIGLEGVTSTLMNGSQEVLNAVISLYAKLLTPKALPTLQAAYNCVRIELMDSISVLKTKFGEDTDDETLQYGSKVIAEKRMIIVLNALAQLGSIKNSIIAMMGLKPSLFTMLMCETPIAEKWFVVNYPGCHYALLYVAKIHSEKHDNFIANSVWLNERNRLSMFAEGPTANYFAKILETLANLLTIDDCMWCDTRLLLNDWVHGIAFGMSNDVLQEVSQRAEMLAMRGALLKSFMRHSLPKKLVVESMPPSNMQKSSNLQNQSGSATDTSRSGVRVRYYTLLRRLGVFNLIQQVEEDQAKCLSDFVKRIFKRSRECEQEKVIGFWQAIPPAIFISNGMTQMAHNRMEFAQQKIPESLFTTEHFALLADFLLNSTVPTFCANGCDDGNWMEDTISIVYAASMGDERINLDYISKWRWALAQMAQYCIDNRLRTPLGKPAETFLKFENEIRRLALSSLTRKHANSGASSNPALDPSPTRSGVPDKEKDACSSSASTPSKTIAITRSRRGQSRGDEEDECEETGTREPSQLSNAEQWWRVRALLETIEMLDKLMNYARDGALFQLCAISQTSQQFFVTNEQTCNGWMSRMYFLTMAVAYGNAHYEHVLRLGTNALRDIQKRLSNSASSDESKERRTTEVVVDATAHTCVSWMVRSLVEMGRYQAIIGVYAWMKKVYRVRLVWIKYAADMAAGRIEIALDGLMKCMQDEKQPENVRKTIRHLIVTALGKIRNPEEMARCCRALNEADGSDETGCVMPNGFDEFAWTKLKGLVTFDPATAAVNSDEKAESAIAWDMGNRLESYELKLMHLARASKKDCRNEIADVTKQLSEDARLLMMADTNVRTHTRATTLHLLATALKDCLKPTRKQLLSANMIDASFLFNLDDGPCLDKLAVGQQLSLWLENCSTVNGVNSLGLLEDERQFHLKMCRLARKTQNLRLADRQLKLFVSKQQQQQQMQQRQRTYTNGLLLQNGWSTGMDKENNSSMALTNDLNNGNWHMGCDSNRLTAQDLLQTNGSSLESALETAKLLWSQCTNKQQSSTLVLPSLTKQNSGRNHQGVGLMGHAEPFALLCDATADEIDRVICKTNLMFNGTPSVPPNALLPLLAHHFTQAPLNDSAILAVGMPTKPQNAKQLRAEGELLAKATLRMAKWLSKDSSLIGVAGSRCQRIAWHMFAAEQSSLPALSSSGSTGGLTGALLSTASKLAPHMAKAHERFAEWAYKSARSSGDENFGGMLLTVEEKDAVRWQIKNVCADVDEITVDAILSALANAHHINALRNDVRSALGSDYSQQIYDQLLGTGSALVQVWTTALGRMMAYYACAVRSYFTYISECANTSKQESKSTIGTVVATLRIVRLLVKHSDSLHALIDTEMRHTNEYMWKDILPQLFARLNHPVAAVRDTLCTLLERIAALSPHAVCFPAVVGTTQPLVMHSAESDDEGEDSESDDVNGHIEGELLHDAKKRKVEQDRSLMFECCQRVVQRLENLYPELVKDVSDFVKELQRINMLNEERWTFVLSNLDHEMNRRIAQIESEKQKTYANPYLSEAEKRQIVAEKTRILSAMVFQILEDLFDRTCVSGVQTVNERQFRDAFKTQISAAFDVYKANKHDPRRAWQPFKQLLIHFTQRANKRSLQTLQTAEVSPRLLQFSHSHIPIPGQESKDFSDVVMIERVSKQSIVLPTKTRPKKVVLIGSDGVDYPFLFKGQEDLHLDERIMQLLHICNLMLSPQKGSTDWPPYSARNYSVTPLGSRSGLIQWVEGATPMFHVYRKWQLRQAARKQTTSSAKGANEAERPSELFFKKLKAAFNSNCIAGDTLTDRQKWPLAILENVLEELIKETPRDLLSRELWLRAGSAFTWYRTTERFARSTAVMSMLGSILGLGDRHLDNVLVNLESGHIVHIDYNICFDKGRNLRVPETVPFRLTGNMVHALGPTQIEGTFRLSCEHVLTKLRAGKEVLLTILDAFVYDPLVDWAAAHDHLVSNATVGVATTLAVYGTDARAEAARPLARALFAVRIKEYEKAWLENREKLYSSLVAVTDILEKIHKCNEKACERGSLTLKRRIGDESTFENDRVEVGRRLKEAIGEHQTIMHDIRPLLKSLASSDGRFQTYIRFYKESFSEPLVRGHKLLDEEKSIVVDLATCIRLFRAVVDCIPQVYEELLLLGKGEGSTLSPDAAESLPVPPPGFEESVPNYKQQQEQNVHAKNVSRKVRQKLEGRDFMSVVSNGAVATDSETAGITGADGGGDLVVRKPMTPAEQADMLIREAVSLSNLALMYEGWTAWV